MFENVITLNLTEYDLIFRLFLAIVFGGLVGLERQKGHKPAGLRTHMMVCLGACLFTVLSFISLSGLSGVYLDPSRIAAGIVTGVGFLGAGAIIHSRHEVSGLTTAASIWTVAAIGMAIGYGFFILAGATSILTVLVLYFLEKVERRIEK